jgi:hypothetical protein
MPDGFTVADVPGAFQTGQMNALAIAAQRAQLQQAQQAALQRQQQQALTARALGVPAPGLQAPQIGAGPAQIPQPGVGMPQAPQQPPMTQDQALAQLFVINPELSEQVFARLGATSQRQRDDAALFAFRAEGLDEQRQNAFLQQRIEEIEARGGDATQTREMLATPFGERREDFKTLQIAALNPQERLNVAQGRQQIKISALTPAEEGGFIGVRELPTGEVESIFVPPPAGRRTEKQVTAERTAQEKRVTEEAKATKDRFERASKLRGEISKASTEFRKIESAFGRVEASVDDPSPAGDLALIFNFMKMLDPGSVVREGEFATAAEAGNVPTRIVGMYNRVIEGERLIPKQRTDFFERSKKLFNRAEKDNKKAVDKIVDIGAQFDVKRSELLGRQPELPIGEPEARPAEPPIGGLTPRTIGRFQVEVVQ